MQLGDCIDWCLLMVSCKDNAKSLQEISGGWLILLYMGWYQAVSIPLSRLVYKDVSPVTSSRLSHSWDSVGTQTGGSHIGHLPCSSPIKLLVGLLQSNQIYSFERDRGTMKRWSRQKIYWTNEKGMVRASTFTSLQTHTIQCWCHCLRAPNVHVVGIWQSLNSWSYFTLQCCSFCVRTCSVSVSDQTTDR